MHAFPQPLTANKKSCQSLAALQYLYPAVDHKYYTCPTEDIDITRVACQDQLQLLFSIYRNNVSHGTNMLYTAQEMKFPKVCPQ